jgi:glycosyltransferase involved in cell wall biosynthesis
VTRDAATCRVSTDRAFVRFACEVGTAFAGVLLVGRAVDGDPAEYVLPPEAEVWPLPPYDNLASLRGVVRALPGTVRAFWTCASRSDVIWAFGPHPLELVLVAIGVLRRKRVVLGVRQDTVGYFRSRMPSGARRLLLRPAVRALDAVHVLLGRWLPTTAVGRPLARRYGPRAFPMTVTLVRGRDRAQGPRRPRGRTVELLTVGRLEPEKAPFVLLEALALMEREAPGRQRLVWIGRGALEDDVRRRASELGVGHLVELVGYVAHGDELLDRYRACDVFVHTALTEGVPQVIVEALATGTPIVATDVGGVRDATGGGRAAELVPPGDPVALAAAVTRLVADAPYAEALAARGLELTRELTLEAEARRVAAFLRFEHDGDSKRRNVAMQAR